MGARGASSSPVIAAIIAATVASSSKPSSVRAIISSFVVRADGGVLAPAPRRKAMSM
jgi:hypothetical protein